MVIPYAEVFPYEQWVVYESVIKEARARGLQFALGGAFGLATYTGRWRNTKDLDIYVLPHSREAMIQVLTKAGFQDYYDQLAYDRSWIYRGIHEGAIVDVIWAMANHRAEVYESWLLRGPELDIHGETVRVVSAEEMLWHKLYVLQRERCDWPDVLNLLYATGDTLDWEYLLGRLGKDTPLLAGVLCVFQWLAPGMARRLPPWLWTRLNLPAPATDSIADVDWDRVKLLDTRPWFAS